MLNIVKRVMTHMNLGDEGKVNGFFKRQQKDLKVKIATNERAIETLNFNKKNSLSKLADRLQDAQEKASDALLYVDIDRLKNNADMDKFAEDFWSEYENCCKNVEMVLEEIDKSKESFKDDIKTKKDQIQELQTRLDLLDQA